MSDSLEPDSPEAAPWVDPPPQQPPYEIPVQPPFGPHAPAPDFRARVTRPLLGPALWTAGVTLWSYVAFGRLVVNQGFPEVAAFPIVMFCFAVSAYVSLERSFAVEPPLTPREGRGRIVRTLALATGLFFGSVSLAVMIGLTSNEDLDALLSLFLTVLGIVAFFVGRRGVQARWLAEGAAQRALGVLLWIASIALTLLAWGS